jgi:pyruvate/2-oxoglutarate dehydrogenase complex dihydrolipoamide dehydrogenase (E3) component
MSSPATENVYDVIVIGTGPIGQTVADRARAARLSVAAVERELVGGECSYWACIPSKAMLRPVVAVADARRVAGARQAVTGPVDAAAVFTRRDGYVTDWNDEGQANFLKSIGADLVRGHGRLYALGDVNHHALLTHQGKYQARIAGAAIGARAAGQPADPAPWGPHAITADYHAVPQVFFCDPQAGAVGLTADQAERAGHRIRVIDVDPGSKVIGANLYADGYTGRARMVVDEDHGYLLGVTMVGPGVEELIHSATVAVAGQVPISRLWHAVPCFPSISEVWLRLLEAYRG